MRGGKAAAQFASGIEAGETELRPGEEPRYKFKNVIMVSSYWDQVEYVKKLVETAKDFGTKFYACYSACDRPVTEKFADTDMKEYLEREPWHLPAIAGHGQTTWDVFTYDSDGNGKADILETIFGNSSEKMVNDITDKNGEIDSTTEPELEADTLNEQDLEKKDIDKTVNTYRRPPEKPNYDFAKVCKIAMEKGIGFQSGEKPSEFIKRVAEELNIPTTTLQEGTFGETPWLNQLDFQEKETGLCGPTSLCMLASAALGYLYTPTDLYRDFQDINKYRDGGGGFGDKLFKDEKILERLNLKLVNINGEAYYGNAWGDYSTPENGLLMEALREGKRAIWCSQKNIFTNGGHYMEVELKNDKIWINDPNGQNYLSNNSTLIDILNNGCDPEVLRQYGGRYYIFDVANKENTNGGDKSDEVLIKEILEASGYNSQNSTEEPKQVSIDESKKTDALDSKFGKIEYVEGLYSINENETSPYYIKKYHVTAPSNLVDSEGNPKIVDSENRPTNVIVSLHGDGNVNGISGKTMADIITNSELDKPYAIIIEPELRLNETANVWGMEYNAETIKSIIDNVNEVFGLSIKDITYTIIRI